ncbi:hypothetical protein DE146DRAFT_647501 [Phaeosphaeria sp. MPI-PUGE-AT-0046c]|nr:hypothetical protein DE146DRAFT_647501 [Phaeosphaeria sp. MPI-PUGE-AT-0046c]
MATTTPASALEPGTSEPTTEDTPMVPPPRPSQISTNSPRLGMPFDRRLLLTTTLASLCGFTLGSTSAGRLASLRFRAENAHRLPISQPGWYLYHKSKNYYKWRFGIVEGLRKGGLLAAWSSIFFVVEESLDVFRGTWRAGRTMHEMEGVDELDIARIDKGVGSCRDFLSSACAGMVTGGLWSAWHAFPISTAARTIRMGLVVGAGYGVLQDGVGWAKRRWGGEEGGESWIYKGARNRQVPDVAGE